jgi:hypothetical protein
MTAHDERTEAPDVDRLARSMLQLTGHDDDDHHSGSAEGTGGSAWSKAPDFAADPERAGLVPVDCRFCHATVAVKKLGPEHTAVQWNSTATQRCAVFAEIRASGGDSSRSRSCPKLSDSIRHAVAEGCLEEVSSAPPPGDG